jgi:cycloartenol synthase
MSLIFVIGKKIKNKKENLQQRCMFPLLQVYSQLEGMSHVVNTAWALLGLMAAGYHLRDPKPLHAGARFLMSAQLASGDWPQQHISGVFNRNCMITYANYK